MKTTRRTWMRVVVLPWMGLLTACLFSVPRSSPAQSAPQETQTLLNYVDFLRISPGGDYFQGQLTDLSARKILYQVQGQGPAALADYRKMVDSLAAPDRTFRITVPLGSTQVTKAMVSQPPPCVKGDEPVWTRFSMQVVGHYLAAMAKLGEQLPEQLSYLEVLQVDPATQEFLGQTVDVTTGQLVYQDKGGKDARQGYEDKIAAIAPQGRRVRISNPFNDRIAGSVIFNPPPPPGPTGQDLHLVRFVVQTISDYNLGKAESVLEGQLAR